MKTLNLATLLMMITPALAFADAKIEAGKYTIDPAHTKLGFEISHLVISTVDGRFNKFSGDVEMNKKLDDTKVDASVDVASIDTGNTDRDNHLKSPDFFDAAKYPTITFKSKKITGSADKLKIAGDLTIHGVTKPVTLEGKYKGVVNDPFGFTRVAYALNTKISRKDFGLTWNKAIEAGPVVGDEVTITLNVEASKPVVAKK
jgi:polyisoprenoid-binding protein YceI